jgi:hypothetical protein
VTTSQSPTDTTAGQLSPVARRDLTAGLVVSLSAELHLPGEEPYPPGAEDYHATYSVPWYPYENDNWEAGDESILTQLAGLEQTGRTHDRILIPVGYAHLVMVDLYEYYFESLDAREADLDYLAEQLFIGDSLHPELEGELQGFDQSAVLVDSVAVDPAWRGLRMGLLGTGVVLKELSRGCRFAALDAIQPGLDRERDRQESHKRLQRYWGKLGFEHWRDRVLVLDLATTALPDALTDLLGQNGTDSQNRSPSR